MTGRERDRAEEVCSQRHLVTYAVTVTSQSQTQSHTQSHTPVTYAAMWLFHTLGYNSNPSSAAGRRSKDTRSRQSRSRKGSVVNTRATRGAKVEDPEPEPLDEPAIVPKVEPSGETGCRVTPVKNKIAIS